MSAIQLREPVSGKEKDHFAGCQGRSGIIRTSGGQDTVWCSVCNRFLYNAPRVETGRAVRTVTTVHNGIKPKQRARIILRDGGRCFLCGALPGLEGGLQVGHCVSVERGLELGMTEVELNDDENLVAMCAECNLGLGSEPVPVRFVLRALMVRLRAQGAA
jgi:hypothetical protein